ncbi:MAG TPA: type II toxin-antitoxin system RelE/ParE family toxin [Thermoanaerobaculia bacterium]|nr:type II toxin-antitoxin system RelE/ParE family toxin [Thermoanaerobaculia bacterium]
MSASPLLFHSQAALEVEEALAWYREQSPTAEERFLADFQHAVEQVASAPRRWPRFRASTRRYVFRRFPYSLIYKMSGSTIRVLAVAHDRRRASYWTSRLRTD